MLSERSSLPPHAVSFVHRHAVEEALLLAVHGLVLCMFLFEAGVGRLKVKRRSNPGWAFSLVCVAEARSAAVAEGCGRAAPPKLPLGGARTLEAGAAAVWAGPEPRSLRRSLGRSLDRRRGWGPHASRA